MQTERSGLAGPAGPGTRAAPGGPGGPGGLVAGIARGAALVAGLTALSRMLGLVRTLVFSQSVGSGCFGTAYVTANQVPNLIYELAIGGALTSAMVPVLARSATLAAVDPAAKERVERICSALLTWGIVILLPLTAAIMVAAGPIASLLIPANPNAACARPAMVAVTARMLVVFAPQVLFYGISVVLSGVLQAYRRFTGPTLAPVIANFVMIGSYLAFAALARGSALGSTPLLAELVLAVGTTMNIGMLVIVALPPTWRLRLRLRPTLVLPAGVIRQVGGLALVGVLEFLAGDVGGVVTIALANGHGQTGALVLNNYTILVFNSVASVFALSVVTSAFPVFSATDGSWFDRACAGSTRAVLLLSWLGAALVVAVAVPAAHILVAQPGQVTQLTEAFVLSAPAVAGQAVIVNASRVMFALGRLRAAGIGLVAPPLLGAALSVPLVEHAPPRFAVGALALATSVSQVVVAVPMVAAIRGMRDRAALSGVGRATLASLAAGTAGAVAGFAAAAAAPVAGKLQDAASGALAALVTIVVFGAVAYLLDPADLRQALARLRRPAGRRPPPS